ncbi:MAG TPA: regulatory protein GemA [Rhodocyclaceae bacterium]|jgi:hypothetical protein|nr:regulatory protein GemA [Rhodocyclaceae bacterium]
MAAAPKPTPKKTPADWMAQRKRAIFAACKANGIDNDARRLIVKNITGRDSMADCTLLQLGEVLDHLNRGKKGYAGRARVTPSADRAPLLAKVDALLAELHRVTGEVRPLSYADGIARRVCKRSSLDFCDPADLRKVVAALTRTLQHAVDKEVP